MRVWQGYLEGVARLSGGYEQAFRWGCGEDVWWCGENVWTVWGGCPGGGV